MIHLKYTDVKLQSTFANDDLYRAEAVHPESQSDVKPVTQLRQEHVTAFHLDCWFVGSYMQANDIKSRHQITRNLGLTKEMNPATDFASSLNSHVTQGGLCYRVYML